MTSLKISSSKRTPVLGTNLKLPLKKAVSNNETLTTKEVDAVKRGPGDGVSLGRTFSSTSEAIRIRLDAFEFSLRREVLDIADMFAKAKAQYDEEYGTGQPGKRNPESVPGFVPAMAAVLGRSESLVQKYLRLAKMDPATRAIIAEQPRISGNLTALLDVAAETDPEKRVETVLAFDKDECATNPLVARAKEDTSFRTILKQFTDPKEVLGGMDEALPPPADLVQKFPELEALPTVGAIRNAIHGLKAKPVKRSKPATPAVSAMILSVGTGKDTPITLRKARLTLKVTAVEGAGGERIADANVVLAVMDDTEDT